jgi:ferredoxin-nitrate reductase
VKLKKVSKPSLSQPESVDLHPEEHPASSIGHMAEHAGELTKGVITGIEKTITPERSHIADYIGLLDESEKRLVKAFQQVRQTPLIQPLATTRRRACINRYRARRDDREPNRVPPP